MFTFTVAPDNADEYQVTVGPRDIVKWERTVKGASLVKLQQDVHYEDLYHLAYLASKRQGLFAGSYELFEETVDITLFDEDDEESFPTKQAA